MFLCKGIDNHEMNYGSLITLLIFHNTYSDQTLLVHKPITYPHLICKFTIRHYTRIHTDTLNAIEMPFTNIIISNIIFTTLYLPPTNGIQVSRLPLMIRIVIWFSLPPALHIHALAGKIAFAPMKRINTIQVVRLR